MSAPCGTDGRTAVATAAASQSGPDGPTDAAAVGGAGVRACATSIVVHTGREREREELGGLGMMEKDDAFVRLKIPSTVRPPGTSRPPRGASVPTGAKQPEKHGGQHRLRRRVMIMLAVQAVTTFVPTAESISSAGAARPVVWSEPRFRSRTRAAWCMAWNACADVRQPGPAASPWTCFSTSTRGRRWQPRPAFVIMHGGSWMGGSRNSSCRRPPCLRQPWFCVLQHRLSRAGRLRDHPTNWPDLVPVAPKKDHDKLPASEYTATRDLKAAIRRGANAAASASTPSASR